MEKLPLTKLNKRIRISGRSILLPLMVMVLVESGWSQEIPKASLNGHLQNLNTVWIPEGSSEWYSMGTIYNRLNFKWYPHKNWTFSTSARNILSYGQLIYDTYPLYTDLLVSDDGYLDLTGPIAKDSSYVLYTNIDRLNLEFSKGNLSLRAGRQRINWGINMVWNPNDIFNTFNFYDFDYVERPGCDALRLQYYTGFASSVEAAVKIDHNDEITAAAMYRFNRWSYDVQVMGGIMPEDVVLGAGWSGYIKTAGFTGEISYFRDRENFADTSGIFILSAGANYTFRNSLFLHGSLLYNSKGTTGKAGWGSSFIVLRDLSPKTFTLARYSLFGQISYPVTPLINADFSGIVNPNDGSFYLGPNVTVSVTDNITLLLVAQLFYGDQGTEFGDYGQLYYLRIKWSF